jgi:tetratricopeptide (TPR) repeat protein
MSGGVRSQKQERAQLVRALRSSGSSWVEIAAALQESYQINPRLAFRYAHGWSQDEAAEEWNKRWPDELKSFKNFSYWESWPGPTGHAPSHHNLGRLAELYECSVNDLLTDLPNFRHLDTAGAISTKPIVSKKKLVLPAARTLDPEARGSTQDDGDREVWEVLSSLLTQEAAPLGRRLRYIDLTELVQVIVMWMQRIDPSVSRRALLAKLSSAFVLAAVSPVLDVLDPEEREPVTRFLQQPDTFDLPALTYTESMITNLRRQSDMLGPQLTVHGAMGHQRLAEQLAKTAPSAFQPRAISAYAELTQFLGWLSLNMGDYATAQRYYDEARSAAHDAENVELVTYILCAMSQAAVLSDKPRIGIDHAAAAAVWAQQANSPLARAYAADVAVRAYAADNQPDRAHESLDQEYANLKAAGRDEPGARWWYFYNDAFYWSTAGNCALKLHRPEEALNAIDQALTLVDPANLQGRIIHLLFRSEVRIQQDEIAEASSIVADVTRLMATNTSQRIVKRVNQVRGLLTPWAHTQAIRDLDELLGSYRQNGRDGSVNAKQA